MSIALIINIVLAAAVGVTVVGLLCWSIAGRGRRASAASSAAGITGPLVVVAVLGAMAIGASPAAATGTGAISGTVTDNAASPKPLAATGCVQALDASTGSTIGQATTDLSGHYTISGLPTGSYKVSFYDCEGFHVAQYYNNKPSLATANVVSVTAPTTTTGINAKLAPAGQISGTVTNNAASPVGLAKMCVTAFKQSTGAMVSAVATDASGHYTLSGLATISYKIQFSDCSGAGYLTQYYNNQPSFNASNPVMAAAGLTKTGINAKMVLGGKISGTVTNNAATPAPLAKMCVYATPAGGGPNTTAGTNASGQYTISGLPTGSYKVDFFDCAGTDYVHQYYNNKPDFSTANAVAVSAPSTVSGINAKMVLGGKVTGTVTDNAASPKALANICVAVYTTAGTFEEGGKTDANGQYTIPRVAPGSRKIGFSDCGTGTWVPQFYNNKPTLAAGNAFSISPGATTAGINAKLVAAGKISGTVTNNAATPAPLANVNVTVLNAATGVAIASTSTNASGQYTVGSLAPGSYKVDFTDCCAGYLPQYYKNQSTLAAANPVSVTGNVTTTGIDAKMVHS